MTTFRALAMVVLALVVLWAVVVVLSWAAVPVMTACLGTAVVWVPCLLMLVCAVVYPLFKGK